MRSWDIEFTFSDDRYEISLVLTSILSPLTPFLNPLFLHPSSPPYFVSSKITFTLITLFSHLHLHLHPRHFKLHTSLISHHPPSYHLNNGNSQPGTTCKLREPHSCPTNRRTDRGETSLSWSYCYGAWDWGCAWLLWNRLGLLGNGLRLDWWEGRSDGLAWEGSCDWRGCWWEGSWCC